MPNWDSRIFVSQGGKGKFSDIAQAFRKAPAVQKPSSIIAIQHSHVESVNVLATHIGLEVMSATGQSLPLALLPLSRVMADVSTDMPDDGVIVRVVACPERTCALIVGLGMADCESCLRNGCSLCGLLNGESTATCRLPTSLCAGKPCPTKVIV